jgi:nicotinate phosphoribosyltransferase
MSFDNEIDAFRNFAKTFPENCTFLIDTYDDLKGAENAGAVAKEMESEGQKLNAVRLDSGDLAEISKKVRKILDAQGLPYVRIFASGDLDEYAIEKLRKRGAKIDAFGVGTRMNTSSDRPYLDVVYKLACKVERGVPVPAMKLSKGKTTLPGMKQVYRQRDEDDKYFKDIISLDYEKIDGEPLLIHAVQRGKVIYSAPSLDDIRKRAVENLLHLQDVYKRLKKTRSYPIVLSPALKKIRSQLARRLKEQENST